MKREDAWVLQFFMLSVYMGVGLLLYAANFIESLTAWGCIVFIAFFITSIVMWEQVD